MKNELENEAVEFVASDLTVADGASLLIAEDADELGLVHIVNKDSQSRSWFGRVNFCMSPVTTKRLARAIQRAATDDDGVTASNDYSFTETIRRVYANPYDFIEVSRNVDIPGVIDVRTVNKNSEDYFGECVFTVTVADADRFADVLVTVANSLRN